MAELHSRRLRLDEPTIAAWTMVGVGFLALALAFSTRASLGLVMPAWERELGWSRGFISVGAAMALVLMASVAPFAGNLVDRRGPRVLIAGGLAAVGSGSLLVAVMDSRALFLFAFGIVAAAGFGAVATHVVASAIAGRFERQRGLAIGVGTAGATAGQLVVVPGLAWLLQAGDWRWCYFALGASCVLLAAVARTVLRPARATAAPALELPAVPADRAGERLRALVRSPTFHALFWSFAICGFTTTGVIETHLLPYAALCGFPPLPSATAYGVLSAVNMIGMIFAGWLADRVHRPALLAGIYFARALCFVLLLFLARGNVTILFAFAVLFGLFDYSTVPVTASLVASHLGLRVMGLAMGLISSGHALGAAAGAWAGGWMFDHFVRYAEIWLASVTLAVAAGLLALSVTETRPPAAPAPGAGRAG